MANNSENQDQEIKKALSDFAVNNKELEVLEALLTQFNIFETLNIYRHEIHHSDFLAYLLNPKQNHHLHGLFLKKFLQAIISHSNIGSFLSPLKIELLDLQNVEIRREWQDIDILIIDEENHFVVIIENKVLSTEHSDQLNRYQKIVEKHFPSYKTLSLYLTPKGDEPTHENYYSVSYERICLILEDLLQTQKAVLDPILLNLIKHYIEILRRYVVEDSEIKRLCEQIYQRHQQAIEKIIEFIPDKQAQIKEYLWELVNDATKYIIARNIKTEVSFIPVLWDFIFLKSRNNWTESGRMLVFAFLNGREAVKLHLVIGPGPQDLREKIFQTAIQHHPPFTKYYQEMPKKFTTIYKVDLISGERYQESTIEEIKEIIRQKWVSFLENNFKELDEIVLSDIKRLGEGFTVDNV